MVTLNRCKLTAEASRRECIYTPTEAPIFARLIKSWAHTPPSPASSPFTTSCGHKGHRIHFEWMIINLHVSKLTARIDDKPRGRRGNKTPHIWSAGSKARTGTCCLSEPNQSETWQKMEIHMRKESGRKTKKRETGRKHKYARAYIHTHTLTHIHKLTHTHTTDWWNFLKQLLEGFHTWILPFNGIRSLTLYYY